MIEYPESVCLGIKGKPLKQFPLTALRNYLGIMTCNRCGVKGKGRKIHIHHKDKNHRNNAFDNLEILCNCCHRREHPRTSRLSDVFALPLTLTDLDRYCLHNGFGISYQAMSWWMRGAYPGDKWIKLISKIKRVKMSAIRTAYGKAPAA